MLQRDEAVFKSKLFTPQTGVYEMFRKIIGMIAFSATTAAVLACDASDTAEDGAELFDMNRDKLEDFAEAELEEEPAGNVHVAELDVTNGSREVRGSCGMSFAPSVAGGAASWRLACDGKNVTMEGQVKDTAADFKCAWVKGVFNGGIVVYSEKACGSGTIKKFKWTYPGTIADGYLIVNYP